MLGMYVRIYKVICSTDREALFLGLDCAIMASTTFLALYVPRIVTNYINKPTRCTFCMYLFYNFCTTLHVSNDISFIIMSS